MDNPKPKISVLTPTIRPELLHITEESLDKQTFQDFEWLVEIGDGETHDLSSALNRMLRKAKGELIVMLQDCIYAPEDGLEMFWKFYQREPDVFFTAPIGKRPEESDNPEWDWRAHGAMREIRPHEWEADWASAPKQAFFNVGGYDEEFDDGWSWENVNLAQRAEFAGYKFKVLPHNRAEAIDHDKIIEHPFRGVKENSQLSQQKLTAIKAGIDDWKLDYLF